MFWDIKTERPFRNYNVGSQILQSHFQVQVISHVQVIKMAATGQLYIFLVGSITQRMLYDFRPLVWYKKKHFNITDYQFFCKKNIQIS